MNRSNTQELMIALTFLSACLAREFIIKAVFEQSDKKCILNILMNKEGLEFMNKDIDLTKREVEIADILQAEEDKIVNYGNTIKTNDIEKRRRMMSLQ